ncbi:hypothetical protein IM25_06515 [Rhodococcus sp. p52]|nr:hypothetical protein IM25_06515 [Rhodococcus sp. p52]
MPVVASTGAALPDVVSSAGVASEVCGLEWPVVVPASAHRLKMICAATQRIRPFESAVDGLSAQVADGTASEDTGTVALVSAVIGAAHSILFGVNAWCRG